MNTRLQAALNAIPHLKPWQLDPSSITTRRVQVWSKSGTMRGLISSETATRLVNELTHYVMTCQAIQEI